MFNQSRHTRDIEDMLQDYFIGTETPDGGDLFPELGLQIEETGLTESSLVRTTAASVNLSMLSGKVLYKYCVRALNEEKLSGRKDTVWRERLKVQDDWKPVWRVFYKLLLNKRSGDLMENSAGGAGC